MCQKSSEAKKRKPSQRLAASGSFWKDNKRTQCLLKYRNQNQGQLAEARNKVGAAMLEQEPQRASLSGESQSYRGHCSRQRQKKNLASSLLLPCLLMPPFNSAHLQIREKRKFGKCNATVEELERNVRTNQQMAGSPKGQLTNLLQEPILSIKPQILPAHKQ